MSIRNQSSTYRHISTQSVSVGSSAAASTAPISSQIYAIRLSSNIAVKYAVVDVALASSTSILQLGANLPAGVVETIAVSPSQVVCAHCSTASNAALTITELSE